MKSTLKFLRSRKWAVLVSATALLFCLEGTAQAASTARIEFGSPVYQVNESQGQATISVVRSGNTNSSVTVILLS